MEFIRDIILELLREFLWYHSIELKFGDVGINVISGEMKGAGGICVVYYSD